MFPRHWHCSEEGECGWVSRARGDGSEDAESGLLQTPHTLAQVTEREEEERR